MWAVECGTDASSRKTYSWLWCQYLTLHQTSHFSLTLLLSKQFDSTLPCTLLKLRFPNINFKIFHRYLSSLHSLTVIACLSTVLGVRVYVCVFIFCSTPHCQNVLGCLLAYLFIYLFLKGKSMLMLLTSSVSPNFLWPILRFAVSNEFGDPCWS